MIRVADIAAYTLLIEEALLLLQGQRLQSSIRPDISSLAASLAG